MHVQMLQQMARRYARRWIHCRCQCTRSRSQRPDHKALGLELDKTGSDKRADRWSKWLGRSPGLREVQVRTLLNPHFSHFFYLSFGCLGE